MTQYAWVIDQTSCIGCHACTTACKSENDVPLGVNRTWVKYVETGTFPTTRRQIAVLRCNHCGEPPCVEICPTGAMFKRPDGIVDFDTSRCIACKACIQACPYDAIYIDPEEHVAEKCNFCSHRVDRGLLPVCVVVCPTESLIFGDLDDPASRVSRLVAARPTITRRPEQGTHPKAFYIGAAEAALDPLATPHGDRYLWAERRPGGMADEVSSLTAWRAPGSDGSVGRRSLEVLPWHPAPSDPPPLNAVRRPNPPDDLTGVHDRSARQGPVPDLTATPPHAGSSSRPVGRVAYDVFHPRAWGPLVGLYLWTKGLGTGPLGILVLALLAGAPASVGEQLAIGIVSLLGVGATALILVADLGRPERFWRILLTPQRRSWLAIGAYILVGYSGLLGLWTLGTGLGLGGSLMEPLGWLTAVGALLAATYTAFLLGQCEARDLWQNPIVAVVLVGQALLLGGAVVLLVDLAFGGSATLLTASRAAIAAGGATHLAALLLGEAFARHPTPNARAASHLLVRGPFRLAFWLGGVVGGGLVPLIVALAFGGEPLVLGFAATVAVFALLWYELAFIAAGQAVPIS